MKRLLWLFPPLALTLAFLIGGAYPGRPEKPAAVVRGHSGHSGPLVRPGESAVGAVAFLKTLRSDPPPPPPPPPPPAPPPPPPPPDVAVTFRASLRGVERDPTTGRHRALVSDASGGVSAISEGGTVGDGWRIRTVSEEAVTLAKGRETRVVRVFG